MSSTARPLFGRAIAWGRRHPDTLLVVAAALVYLIVQLTLLAAPNLYGPSVQFWNADQLLDARPNWHSMRIGLLFPMKASQVVLGYTEAAFYAVPIVAGIGLMLATYTVARLWFGRAAGVAAMVLVVFNPWFLQTSSQPFPDVLAAALLTGALALAVYAGRSIDSGAAPEAVAMTLAGAGLLLGWAYLAREFSVIFFPVIALALLGYRVPFRSWSWMAGTALLMLGVEFAWGLLAHGDPFTRFDVLLTRSFDIEDSTTAELLLRRAETRAAQGTVWRSATVLFDLLGAHTVGLAFMGMVAAIGAATVLVRDRIALLAAAWLAVPWLAFILIGVYQTPEGGSILRLLNVRYWYPLLPAIAVGGVGAVAVLAKRYLPRLVLPAGIVGLISATVVTTVAVIGIGAASAHPELERRPDSYRELRTWLASHGDGWDSLHTDVRTRRILPAFTSAAFRGTVWDGNVRRYDLEVNQERPARLDDALILVNTGAALDRGPAVRERLVAAPPERWQPVFVSSDGYLALWAGTAVTSERTAPVTGWEHPGAFSIADGDTMRVELDAEPIPLDGGEIASIRTELSATGAGTTSIWCTYSDGGRPAMELPATTGFVDDADSATIEFLCRPSAGPVLLSVALVVTGPEQGTVGAVTVVVSDPL